MAQHIHNMWKGKCITKNGEQKYHKSVERIYKYFSQGCKCRLCAEWMCNDIKN